MKVPFLDLGASHVPLRDEFTDLFRRVMESGEFVGGPMVSDFEKSFASYCGSPHAVGVGSGTDALWLALEASGVGAGDEVITVPMTFIATAEAISRTGARPVFVDIDPVTYTMDPEKLARALTPRTKAILPVHLFGRLADMEPILSFARRHGLLVFEDAAQAHGASVRGQRAGSFGDAGCFSFYPGKNLGAFGEAGAVVTRDAGLAERMRMLRDHGQRGRHRHEAVGWNCRMDAIQAGILSVKLRRLDDGNDLRRRHASRYSRAFTGLPGMVAPAAGAGKSHVHHLYVVQAEERAKFVARLGREGVASSIHYPTPIHLQPAYAHLGYSAGSFPVSERCAQRFVSIPMFPGLEDGQIRAVIGAVTDACHAGLSAA